MNNNHAKEVGGAGAASVGGAASLLDVLLFVALALAALSARAQTLQPPYRYQAGGHAHGIVTWLAGSCDATRFFVTGGSAVVVCDEIFSGGFEK